ncbi:MORN repeat-containing protein 1 isoform X2 [Ambystoma mexicanum]|uniref:MORN repeat-containing protein 1 isoform X2 n=1 Tax=Ambystoma mexicanum TaxID=8296 RepID=UPI0037E7D803
MATQRSVGGRYIGEVKKQLRDGFGIYVYPNSFFRYEGQWKKGKKHGHGKLLLKDGSYYEGEFADGEIEGNGSRYWAASGNAYSGQFSCGELHGSGVMQYGDGARYEGEFDCGLREGHGMLVDKDGQTYEGSFHNNKKHGEGQMSYRNGDHYEGDWVLDQRQGHGVLHCADGTIYEGQWRSDTFSGQGAVLHCSGVTYDGLWINGCPAGLAKKIVIMGDDVIEVLQGSPFTFHVQLQTEDGQLSESDNGRVLKIWAGIKNIQRPATQNANFLEILEDLEEEKPVQTPFGFECISYPLMSAKVRSGERKAGDPVDSPAELDLDTSFALAGKIELESRSNIVIGLEDFSIAPDGVPKIAVFDESDDSPLPPAVQRVEMGAVVFADVMLAPPPAKYRSFLLFDEPVKKAAKKPSGGISAEKAERLTVSQEKIGDSRTELTVKGSKSKKEQPSVDDSVVRPGEYVIMVHEVTKPPFLGQTLPPAFKLLHVLLDTVKSKSLGETVKVPSM